MRVFLKSYKSKKKNVKPPAGVQPMTCRSVSDAKKILYYTVEYKS